MFKEITNCGVLNIISVSLAVNIKKLWDVPKTKPNAEVGNMCYSELII